MNAASIGEVLQDCRRIIADGRQSHALATQRLGVLIQLDQLGFAERSPVGGAVEHHHQALRPAQRFESLRLSVLIGKRKRRKFLPRFRTRIERRLLRERKPGNGQQNGKNQPHYLHYTRYDGVYSPPSRARMS